MRLLLVEDERILADTLLEVLTQQGHTVEVAYRGDHGWELACADPYDVLILDWMLPGLSGIEITQRLRKRQYAGSILLLTAKDTTRDKVQGLDAGADDYLLKPFEMVEFLARVRALGRRIPSYQPETLQFADLSLDSGSLRLRSTHDQTISELSGKPDPELELQRREFQILDYLMRHPGQILSHEQIFRQVWGSESTTESNVLAVQIRQLRQKLHQLGSKVEIQTVYGMGYRLGVGR